MIRITRGPEPATLSAIRASELARVRTLIAAKQALTSDLIGKRYKEDEMTRLLRAAQHGKCCYCDQFQPTRNRDVEHYRPKTVYWWLTWTWENLMFACDGCNRYEKNDAFPLWPRTRKLQPEEQPPGPPKKRERPMLLDPAAPDAAPMKHLQFRSLDATRWLAMARGGSRYGAETIRVLGLNRDDLIEARRSHYETFYPGTVEPLRRGFEAAKRGDATERAAFRERWRRVVGSYVQPYAPLAAFNRDILDHHFPLIEREMFALPLPDEL
jgi:uncharacterized protein (TIGR02646 family)